MTQPVDSTTAPSTRATHLRAIAAGMVHPQAQGRKGARAQRPARRREQHPAGGLSSPSAWERSSSTTSGTTSVDVISASDG